MGRARLLSLPIIGLSLAHQASQLTLAQLKWGSTCGSSLLFFLLKLRFSLIMMSRLVHKPTSGSHKKFVAQLVPPNTPKQIQNNE